MHSLCIIVCVSCDLWCYSIPSADSVFQIKFSMNAAVSKKPNLQRQKKVFTKHKGVFITGTQYICIEVLIVSKMPGNLECAMPYYYCCCCCYYY